MTDTIYKNDRKENLKIFRGMERQDSYSKYSGELNQIFKENSFNVFYKNLISNNKKSTGISPSLYSEQNTPRYLNNNNLGESFDLRNYKHFIKNLKKECELEEQRRLDYFKKLKLVKSKEEKSNSKEKENKKNKRIYENPSIGWYHPNYNSIRKNEPRIFIGEGYSPKKILEDNKKNNNNKIYNSLTEENIHKEKKHNGLNSTKINKKSRNLSGKKIKTDKIENDYFYDYYKKKNNAMKFSKYSWRKPLISENITSNIKSNSEIKDSFAPEKLKGLVEFNKMSSNLSNGSFIQNNSNIPPLGLYKPNYESIEKKSPDVYLSKKNTVITKQMKLKKLLYDYNVPKEYELVPKLN